MTTEVICPTCNGFGTEMCDNPDHGWFSAVGGDISRLGCPGCGHDEHHRVMGTVCPDCSCEQQTSGASRASRH
jgi:hypothetical protein